MKNLISVIIPVYNMEKYLVRCIESIINQSYCNLEIILVNDGSTDNSQIICEEYEAKDSRVKVINKQNGGLSSARNSGLNISNGDFISFIDSDDWIDLETYEHSIKLLIENSADVIEFDYKNVTRETKIKQPKEKIKIFKHKEILDYYMRSTTKTGSYSVCRCLFSKKVVENFKFREGRVNEDIDFKYKVLSKSNSLITSNQIFYYYYQSGDSLSTGGFKNRDFDLYEATYQLEILTSKETYGKIKKLGKVKVARTSFSLLSKIAYYGIDDKEIIKEKLVRKLVKELRRDLWILLNSPISIPKKILAILFCINYRFAESLVIKIKG